MEARNEGRLEPRHAALKGIGFGGAGFFIDGAKLLEGFKQTPLRPKEALLDLDVDLCATEAAAAAAAAAAAGAAAVGAAGPSNKSGP